jgi:hypothetical protein
MKKEKQEIRIENNKKHTNKRQIFLQCMKEFMQKLINIVGRFVYLYINNTAHLLAFY